MAVKTILCFSFLLCLVSSGYCPTYSCSALATNVCASHTSSSSFQLNSNGCSAGYYCSAAAANYWALNLFVTRTSPGTTLACSANPASTYTPTTPMNCGTKQNPHKNFKNGQTVLSCSSDTDCALVDGTYADCTCIFKSDNTGICEAHTSNDQVFGGFWKDCGSSNTITDKDTAAYWSFYVAYWEYTKSTVSCMNIFEETATLSKLYSAYTTKPTTTTPTTPTTPTTNSTSTGTTSGTSPTSTTTEESSSQDNESWAVTAGVLSLLVLH